jgi:hypothetical protein
MHYLAYSVAQWNFLIEGVTIFRVPETGWKPGQRSLCRDEAMGWTVGGSNPDRYKTFIYFFSKRPEPAGPTQPAGECVSGSFPGGKAASA